MTRRPPLFGSTDLVATATRPNTSSRELDLRAEFECMLFGDSTAPRHGHLVVVRHMRRDSNGDPIPCTCLHEITREADPDCSYCDGDRYLWDEVWYWCYSMYSGASGSLANRGIYMPPGLLRVDFKIFFFQHGVPIRYGDKIVEMKLDDEGAAIVPYIRESIYSSQTIQRYRSDNGRVEYQAIYCREDSAIRPDAPQ